MRVKELPPSPSRNVLTTGMPAQTEASKLSATPRRSASAASFWPCRAKRAFHRALGRIAGSAHELDKHIDRRILRQRHGIGDPAEFLRIDSAFLRPRPRVDRHDLDGPAAARHELVAAVL